MFVPKKFYLVHFDPHSKSQLKCPGLRNPLISQSMPWAIAISIHVPFLCIYFLQCGINEHLTNWLMLSPITTKTPWGQDLECLKFTTVSPTLAQVCHLAGVQWPAWLLPWVSQRNKTMNYTKIKYFVPTAYYKIIILTYHPLTRENAEAESLVQSHTM